MLGNKPFISLLRGIYEYYGIKAKYKSSKESVQFKMN